MAQDFIERLIDERNELDAKVAKLEVFMMKPEFQNIDLGHQLLLKKQLRIMQEYSDVLLQRLILLQN